MLITVQTKRVAITPRQRQTIERYIRRVFDRQRWQIAQCAVTIAPEVATDLERLACHVRLASQRLGSISVRDTGETMRTAVQQAALRAREVVRRRLHKRRAKARRFGRHIRCTAGAVTLT
jgi:ribosome-associated translation inhibitor RaiA